MKARLKPGDPIQVLVTPPGSEVRSWQDHGTFVCRLRDGSLVYERTDGVNDVAAAHVWRPAPSPTTARVDYTRDELIRICGDAIVPVGQWRDRDTAAAQRQVGEAWALLRAGAAFHVSPTDAASCPTDRRTVWVAIAYPGFDAFEGGDLSTDLFYLPTPERLAAIPRPFDEPVRDWY